MKVNFKISMALAGLLALNTVSAETFYGVTELSSKMYDQLIVNGPATLKDIKTDNLTVHGPLTFQKIDVIKSSDISGMMQGQEGAFANLKVTGPLEAEKITCDTLSVIGPAKLKYFTVKGTTEVQGPIEFTKGNLQDLSYMASGTLTDTVVKNITIKHNNASADTKKNDILKLEGNTSVTGDITFESGKGEVITAGKGVTVSGKIKGGTLKQ